MDLRNEQLITIFKVLADPVRVRIVALCASGECSVSEITRVTGLSQPRVSQHLKALCDAGLLTRFRDGQFMFYRLPGRSADGGLGRRVMDLVAPDDAIDNDLERLRRIRAEVGGEVAAGDPGDEDRLLYRYLVDLSVAAPLGNLLDIGCGRGDVLKLLASRAHRAVGVDIDPSARRLARAELLTAGIPNCSLRQGDMYALPFDDGAFDTVILDDVLFSAERPAEAMLEAARLATPNGRLVLLSRTDAAKSREHTRQLADWCAEAGVRMAAPRALPAVEPRWLFAVATKPEKADVAA